MRFVNEYGIDKMYNELQNYMNTFTRESQVYDGITISAMHDPISFYKTIQKYEDVRWNGCELNRVSMFSYRTTYADMNGLQFAYYIYWRTKTLSGDVLYCDNSYFYAYVYELLAGFHASNVDEGYHLLLTVYKAYRRFDKKIDKYLPKWILSYCIIHGIYDEKKSEIEETTCYVDKMQQKKEKILNNDYSDCFDIVMSASAYKMDKYSKFYMGRKDAKIIDLVFDDAMFAINDCMYEHDLILSEFMIGKAGKSKWVLMQATPWENNIGLFAPRVKYNKTFVYDGNTYEYNFCENAWYYDVICESGKISGGQDNPKTNYRYHMWIRDYWITYCDSISYQEFKAMFKYDIEFEGDEIQEAINAIDVKPLENHDYLEFFSTNADYRMNKARTVLEGNEELLAKCLRETVEKIKVLFAKRGLVWDEFLQEVDYEIAEKRRDPFRRMIISYDTLFLIAETFKGRVITEYEDYSIEFDRVKKDMKYLIRRKRKTYWKSRYFVECIGKLCELHLRNWLGLEASFKADLDKLCAYFPQLTIVVEDEALMDTISTAVANVCVKNNVERSVASKDSIEHLINYRDAERILEEDAKAEFESAMLYRKISTEEIAKARQVLQSNQEKLIIEDEQETEDTILESVQETGYSEVQVRILKLLLNGDNEGMQVYVSEAGCNLVLEIEKINEIAMEDLGDILIDNDGMKYFVYEDYADYIEGL